MQIRQKSVGGTLSNQETNSNIAFPGAACGVGFGLGTFLRKRLHQYRMRRFAIVSAFKSGNVFRQSGFLSIPVHHLLQSIDKLTGNAIGPYEDLLTSVKRRKLKWYGHVTRSSGLAKTILQGTVQGGRRRGRQRKRWEDNIKEWTCLEWNIILRKAENRKEWRKLVVKSTVVPQRSARLQDR